MATNEMAANEMAANEMAADEMAANEMAANEMEQNEIINRALSVVISNPEWVEYIKDFDGSAGFMFANSPLLGDIKDAIDEENPIHSGASLAMCLQKCKKILNKSVL